MLLYSIYTVFVSLSTHLAILAVSILRFIVFVLAGISPVVAVILVIAAIVLVLQIPYVGGLALIPYLILMGFGVVKKNNTWSVVYDSKTKLPIDPAYVIVRNMQGKEISTIITDLSGRFSLLLPQGLYVIEANKTNYVFPSSIMSGARNDGKYSNLYFGSIIEIKESEQSVTLSIPMDPINEDWNQVEKKRKKLFYQFDDPKTYTHAAKIYSTVAVLFAFFRFAVYQTSMSLTQFLVAVVAFCIVRVFAWRSKQYPHSFIVDKDTHQPLPFARVSIFSAVTKSKVSQKVTSYEGQFTCLLPKGGYYVTIDRRDAHGNYSLVHTSEIFSVNDGYIGKRFAV